MRAQRARIRLESADLKPQWLKGGDRQRDGHFKIPPFVLQYIGPLGPLPKKVNSGIWARAEKQIWPLKIGNAKGDGCMDQVMDRPTNGHRGF